MNKYKIIMCICCVVGIITACTSQLEEMKPTKPTEVTTSEVSTHSETIKQGSTQEKATQTIDDEPITITLVEKDFLPSNVDDLAYIEKINEALLENGIGAKLELMELPQGEYSEKLKMMVEDGEVPDIMWLRDGIDTEFVEQGLLLDYTPYIEESILLQEAMEPYHQARIAAYPYLLRIRYNTPKVAMIRKDWLDALGLDLPETVDDYYKLLKAIADSDFDDNGEKDTYGIIDTGGTYRLDTIFNAAFGMPTTWIQDDAGSYVYHKVTQYEKEKLAFYRKLMKQHILDPDYMMTRWDTMEEKLYTGKVGMVIGSAGKVLDIYQEKLQLAGIDTTLIPLNPPQGKLGRGFSPVDVTGEDRGFAISSKSEHPHIAFQILEFMASPEGQYLDRLGFEGRDYEVDSMGGITRSQVGHGWYARFFDAPSWESPVPLLSDTGQQSLDITANYYLEDINYDIPDRYKDKWDSMMKLYNEYAYKIMQGEYELSAFDEFVSKWYEMGGEDITRLANDAFK